MLKVNVDFGTLLIGVEGTKTPAGVRGRGDPTGAESAEEKKCGSALFSPDKRWRA